jgi:hypothetical protein
MAAQPKPGEITIITFHNKKSQETRPPLTITVGSSGNLSEIALPSGRILVPFHCGNGTTELKVRGAPRGNADWYNLPIEPVIISNGQSGQVIDQRLFGTFKTVITAVRLSLD